MKPLARRAVASLLSALIVTAQWPATAWAGAPEPNPAEAMKLFRDLGVYKGDDDPLKTYLGDDGKLTPIGKSMYRSLKSRYNPTEEVEAMKPILDRLRNVGPYNTARQEASARAAALLTSKFGAIDQAPAGSVEESFRVGAMREALMTGAAIPDPPQKGTYMQVEIPDGFEFWDAKGLAFKMTKNQVTTYNRELQKTQRQMNLNLPPRASPVPETGRYNYEMFQYSFYRLKNQEDAYIEAARIDRMIGLAELLNKQYPTDLWFKDKRLEADLIREAKAKTYDHHGTTYSVFDLVDAKFKQRRAYIEGASAAVLRYQTDMIRFNESKTITDAQVATLSLDEQNALRWLSLTVLETQKFHVKNQSERVDPTAPDAQAIMKIIDHSDMTDAQKRAYKEQGRRMKARLDELNAIIEKTRKTLNAADYAGSLDTVQAALAATQKELGELSVDYSIYLEVPSTGFLAKSQTGEKGYLGWNPLKLTFGNLYTGVSTVVRGAYKHSPWGGEYAANMKEIESKNVQQWKDGKPVFKDGKPVMVNMSMADLYTEMSLQIANGKREDWAAVRQRIIQMNPNAMQYQTMDSAEAKLDAVRIAASLKASHKPINAVTETNKTLDAISSYATWTISIALMAPMARASLNLVGKFSTLGADLINAGAKGTGFGSFAKEYLLGRPLYAVGEIARHSAARLESLEPSAARVRDIAGENALAQYLVASGARAGSVAIRQGMFTALSGTISAGFTVGSHYWDMATNRIGGVNIGGYQLIEPGHTMFSEDNYGLSGAVTAFGAGFKGGAWWANESFHPALGYIGLPSTVFGGTKLAGAMETFGSRGVVGTITTSFRGTAAIEAAAAKGEMGFLEKMAESKWYTLKPTAAFGLSMADNVAKYAIFSQVAGYVGKQYAWYVDTNVPVVTLPFIGQVTHPEEDVERRIKSSNQTGHAWLESPLWLLIPTHAAHGARDAGPYMMTREGMKQYDAVTPEFPNGRTADYVNTWEGRKLPLDPVKPPVSARLFEARLLGEKPATEWIVTKQAQEIGLRKEVRRLAKEGGEINPLELMTVQSMTPGRSKWRTLNVVEETHQATYDVAVEAIAEQPKNALAHLRTEYGKKSVWGEATPENKIEVARSLYYSETKLGTKLPAELSAEVRRVLQPMLDGNIPINVRATTLQALVSKFPSVSPQQDKAQREDIGEILAWEIELSKGMPNYGELATKLRSSVRAKLEAGEINAAEAKSLISFYDAIEAGLGKGKPSFSEFNEALRESAEAKVKSGVVSPSEARVMQSLNDAMVAELGKGKPTFADVAQRLKEKTAERLNNKELTPEGAELLTAFYDYILEGDRRFNSFNKANIVKSRAADIFTYLRNKYSERPDMIELVGKYEKKVNDWAGSDSRKADGAGVERADRLSVRVEGWEKELKAELDAMPKDKIAPSERAALEKALTSVKTSAWIVRDAKGGEIPGWRPKQFVRLSQAFLGEGSHAEFVKTNAADAFKKLRSEHKVSPRMMEAIDVVEMDVNAWVKSRQGKGEGDGAMKPLIEKIGVDAKARIEGLSIGEREALIDLVADLGHLDREGLHKGILTSGRDGGTVQLFVKAPTSLGKTLLAYEGLLPYLEAEAKASGRKVMFLTFNTKLQAQAEFDFRAFNKLGSEIKFETYEGLKTMIAEGKTKGRNVAEEWLMLQDEMDAAGQQPALTIGMVSGRVTRLNGQTTALNESNNGLTWAMARLNKVRVEAAEVHAQRLKALAEGLDEVRVPSKQLAEIKVASEDVLHAVGELKNAKGDAAINLAEEAIRTGTERLNQLASRLPASEAEASATMLSALGRMKESLASRPAADPAVQARLALEMEGAFVNQRRLMNLTDTAEGLLRLPAEARKVSSALEAKISNLEKSLAEAEKSNSPAAKDRAVLLREQIEFAKIEKTMVERFDGVDASARLISVDEQIAAIRSGETPAERLSVNPKLNRLMRLSVELEAQIEATGKYSPETLALYRSETGNRMRIERSIGETELALRDAKQAGRPTEAFEAKLKSLGRDLELSKGEMAKHEAALGAGDALPELSRLTRESIGVERRIGQLELPDAALAKAYRAETANAVKIDHDIAAAESAIKDAKKSGKPTDALDAELVQLNAGRKTTAGELRKLETSLGRVKSTPKLDALVREAQTLEAGLSPGRRAAHQEYRENLDKMRTLNTQIGEADAAIRPALESERATLRGRQRSIELDLFEAPAAGDLGGMIRRVELLSAKAERLEAQILKGERVKELKAELKETESELKKTNRDAREEVLKRFNEAGDMIVKLTKEGKPGWDAQVGRLLETRRALQESYAGDESSLYTAYREMKENARPLGEDPRLTRKPYEIAGGEGMEPGAILKRTEFLIERAGLIEAKTPGAGAGKLETQLLLARSKVESILSKPMDAKAQSEFFAEFNHLRQLEGELLKADSFHAADLALKRIDGDSFSGFATSLPRFLWQAFKGELPEMTAKTGPLAEYQASMGLTRYHAAKMLEALSRDPMRPAHQRDALMWSYLHSMLFPKGIGHTKYGSSYVRSEIINMVQGFHDNPAGVRGNSKMFNVVHNGQWFESMDNASRRWWELEYGTDLTLPYTHNAMSTIRDVITNKKSYFISLSGTSGNEFEAFMREFKVSMVGEGSAMPKNVLLELVTTPEQRMARLEKALKSVAIQTKDMAVLRVTDTVPDAAKKGIEEYFATHGLSREEPQVLKISEVSGEAAKTFLTEIRKSQDNTGLIVLSVSDTRALRAAETYLRDQGVKQDEIAKVFADTEFLRLNKPEADVLSQMNIEGLNTGKVRVLILDTRVGGRGLDLNFKGERNSTAKGAFRGYTKFEMFVMGPQEMSQVHMVQAMGRIDTGRTLKGAPREFTLLMDIEAAAPEAIFQKMFESDAFFAELRKDPTFQDFVRKNGGRMDWPASNNFFAELAMNKTGDGALQAQRYKKVVSKYLLDRNYEVERSLLRQANVLLDQPSTGGGKHPALEIIR